MSLKELFATRYHDFKLLFRQEKYNAKVFCIGYNKTGTTSVGKSLEALGYKNSSFNLRIWKLYNQGEIKKVLRYTAKFDSCDDLPWLNPEFIPILDEHFPGSKFIYLERDETSWKKSMLNWRKKVFNDVPDIAQHWKQYKEHEKFVTEYFSDRSSEEFISLNIKDPNGFKKLAEFLGKDPIQDSFSHFNKT